MGILFLLLPLAFGFFPSVHFHNSGIYSWWPGLPLETLGFHFPMGRSPLPLCPLFLLGANCLSFYLFPCLLTSALG